MLTRGRREQIRADRERASQPGASAPAFDALEAGWLDDVLRADNLFPLLEAPREAREAHLRAREERLRADPYAKMFSSGGPWWR